MKWIEAKENIVPTLTRNWSIFSKYGAPLGTVKWYSGWRRYAFFPEDGTLFEADCLWDLAEFCDVNTKERKAQRNLAKSEEQKAKSE